MRKLFSVLRSLLLLFLSGWLGIVAQPAEAQQTVTLSGRVTDSAGQAVSRGVCRSAPPSRLELDRRATDGWRWRLPLRGAAGDIPL